jgi:glycerophosphoryl diester phosphodiesterase
MGQDVALLSRRERASGVYTDARVSRASPAEAIVTFFRTDQPLILAHRGASRIAPENTLTAFRLALEQGADGLELDVRLSRDGVPVVFHDAELSRTTDGQGRISEKTLAELRALDAGRWFDPCFAGEQIPTLEEVLKAFGDQTLYNIELKTFGVRDDGLVRAVLACIRRQGLAHRTLLSSFNPLALRRAWRLAPEIPRGLLVDLDLPLPLRRAWLAFLVPHQARHLQFRMIEERTVSWCRRRGLAVMAWTVNDPQEAERLIRLRVDGLITDEPALLAHLLGDR